MKTEVSAGGVVVKKINGFVHVLLIKDRQGDWMLPKGWIEQGETPQEAAFREIGEEAGLIHIRMLHSLASVHYSLVRSNQPVDKTIYFFLFEQSSKEELIPQKDEGITEVEWFPLKQAFDIIAYPQSYQPTLDEVRMYIDSHPL